jgi:hypothetical protein
LLELDPFLCHGNRVRCYLCALLYKRKYNRDKQRILRQVGKVGLKNFQILENITLNHDWDNLFLTTMRKLVSKGFDFSQGGKTYDTFSEDQTTVFIVIDFQVYYNPTLPNNPVIIKLNS